jgi:hypothetical protein
MIYPITALQKNSKEIRERAEKDIVHITENGSSAYVFCSENVLAERIKREREDAAFEARMGEAIGRGLVDIDTGSFYGTIESAFTRVEELRGDRA